jgi:hypothetical protein
MVALVYDGADTLKSAFTIMAAVALIASQPVAVLVSERLK